MKPKIYFQNRFLLLVIFSLIAIGIKPVCCYAGGKGASSSMNELRQELDKMFAKLDRNVVPTGLLRDYAIEYENLDNYDVSTNRNNEKVCDVISYSNVLSTLQSSSLQADPFKSFITDYEKNNTVPHHLSTVRLSVVLYEYAQIKSNALKDKLIAYKHGQVFNASKKAFQLRKVCASCILDDNKATNNIVFSLPNQFILSNIGITNVEVDYGKGYQSIMKSKINAYLCNGIHTVKIRLTDRNRNVYFTNTTITIAAKSSSLTRSGVSSYLCSGSYKGITTSADVTVVYSSKNNSGKLKKPFVVVEGFDPRDFNPEGRGRMYDTFIYGKWDKFIKRNDYDFIYVDWREPGEYIQANAYTLIEVLKKLKGMSDETTQPILLVGHSMGGLVARYALKTMENQHIAHSVGTYVSYDSPHLGANIPQSLLYGFYGLRKFLKEKNVIGSIARSNDTFAKLLAVGERMAYSTATQQMLVDYVDPAGRPNNDEHIRWQKELAELGFPQGDAGKKFQMLGVANSDFTPIGIPEKYISCDFSAGSSMGTILGAVVGRPIAEIFSFAVGVLLQDVIAGLLCYLPGKDSVTGGLYCLPGTSVGQKVTHLELNYKKDYMWLVPIKKNLFSYNGYYSESCLYDTYPSSRYNVLSQTLSENPNKEWPLVFDLDANIYVNSYIPFIPSASALACGDGINMKPSSFTVRPTVGTNPFGLNYHLESNPLNQSHSSFSNEAQYWIETHLGITIEGPSFGYTGAKYSLANAEDPVVWNSSDVSIAAIDQQGVLTVKGSGVVQLLAQSDGESYSRTIIVGLPHYVLSSQHEPGGFKIEASCIDKEFQDYIETVNKTVLFQWGVKFPDKSIVWNIANSPAIFIPLENKDAVVFFKVCDANGNESVVQSVKATGNDVFLPTNNHIKVDVNKNLYKENGSSYSYKRGKLYLTRDASLPEEYQRAIWTAMEADVFSPFSNQYNITIDGGEMMLKDILPEEELDYVVNNLEVGQTYSYTIALKNPQKKIIQFLPFTITLK